MSLIKGSKNVAAAKQFYDWALTPEAQILASQAKFFHVQSNTATPAPAGVPKVEVKLIDYDFAKYGAAPERKRLLLRWDNEIRNMAK